MLANAQNLLNTPKPERAFGIRVTLKRSDPFTLLVGKDWHREHWYESEEKRDIAYAEMLRRHEYSRKGDEPAIKLEKI